MNASQSAGARPPIFAAPWGRSVTITTLFASLVLVVAAALPWILSGGSAGIAGALPSLVSLGVLIGCGMSGIRGYVVRPDVIEVPRFGWTTRLPRAGLQGVEVAPGVMRGSLRTFGNGGLFGLTGRFRNSRLGAYRALVTDTERTVVLHYPGRRVVLSPDRPAEFAEAIGVRMLTGGSSTAGATDAGGRRLVWFALIPALTLSAVGVAIYVEMQPVDVRLDVERLQVDGGFYDLDLPLARIRDVELRDSRPPVTRRTNGFAVGSALRGYFEVEGLGRTRVFVDSGTGPYLLLRTDGGPVVLSLQNAEQTRQLAESLRVHSQPH